MPFEFPPVNNYIAVRADGTYHSKGAYVKELNDLDYDLPIVNEAVKNYILNGTPVDETIYTCCDFRSFQKIVKLSSKYKWVEHEQGRALLGYKKRGAAIYGYRQTVKYDNKAYRVFASKDENDGRLLKCKPVEVKSKTTRKPITEPRVDSLVCAHDNGGGWCENKSCLHYGKRCPFYGRPSRCDKYKEHWYDAIVGYEEVQTETIKRDKFGNTPDHCFVYNGDVKNAPIHPKLDREWYVDLARKRLEDFGVI